MRNNQENSRLNERESNNADHLSSNVYPSQFFFCSAANFLYYMFKHEMVINLEECVRVCVKVIKVVRVNVITDGMKHIT